ncbi:CMP-2-keto-3-deoxyoctulosonic acid synthetase (KdsB) (PDB:1VH1) [Commensalibacter communis]|uniref:CMP-2-keto-3-deoxyoctulosonic acid synthetase (KdsB) n=1 Tax=Commensalibacter communis TaxID=2972786 RepID=A0A9W4TMU7_9PROT|nr:3-deoxy-manno-octulosonate cytidylyltransferase [Commensalibacter communis]CAI3927358.1 CMP-2-keto-3-deoxyoctulosonic acid synthetase (KdsB) (PDB:1VH1) [Commensalibacter communis]CAI3927967.1 CMP-2-keto-3-deoxyoctulosonic acid synthetase (KdsB) (PDB:1VH1) [Commensalibacter communis]CAI3933504.1 CMP-2-keto-3-deoxyoctulosonic acid synthetase (KdsB) (PDB:1VH1) [Commensalibacter communis]CAI3935051.1 CMP-2-keto-3-deoxyoctulosonic acid synthetase (KdsB) (PDB:1VH1) [Commensalibacter communis]CAI3
MNALIIIPARLAATRLPNKPLADIHGKPMIVRVMEQAQKADIGPVIVASGDREITETIKKAGGAVIETDPNLPSGSDRVYQAFLQVKNHQDFDVIINLQGDLPLIDPKDIRQSTLPLSDQSVNIATLIAPVKTEAERNAPSVVKVACSFDENAKIAKALYFSRCPIPYGDGPLWHHVGIYAYRKAALKQFISMPTSSLENREKLEQLRALEAGMTIGCATIEAAPFGVDTPEDLDNVRRIVKG